MVWPNGSHSLTAKAYDGAGNSASASITVSTEPDFNGVNTGVVSLQAVSRNTATDNAGNIVTVGYFFNTVNFGNGPLVSVGGKDSFICKYNSAGNLLWAKGFGSVGNDEGAQAVVIDSIGNIIVVGSFAGAVDFGGQTLTAVGNQSDPYAPDIFVVKYDNANPPNLVWVKQFGGTYSDHGRAVAVDGNGNIFLAADFSSPSIAFGPYPINNGASYGNFVLAKLSAGGLISWAKGWGGSGVNQPSTVAIGRDPINGSEDIVVTGTFSGSTDLGGGSKAGVGFGNDLFLAKYSGADGHHLWDKTIGTSGSDYGNGVATDPTTGNVVITGLLGSAVNFDNISVATGGIFLASYGPSGNCLWAKTFNSSMFPPSGNDVGNAVSVDGTGNIVFTGTVNSTINFGSGWQGGSVNYFIASFTSSGTYQWSKRASGAGSYGYGIAFDKFGHIVTAGAIVNSTVYFDGALGDAGGSASTASGTTAPFVVQYLK
jgi:hypothetical protein